MRAVSDRHCSKPSRHDGALSCSRYKNEPFLPVWLWLTLHVDPFTFCLTRQHVCTAYARIETVPQAQASKIH